MEPEVSVVVATFHRPRALRYALATALRQTVTNIEVIVVGDACTDDTAAVVADISRVDPRVRFINLETNVGDQSGPNNVGVATARGRCVAFLNHDDLWWPDHLETGLRTLRETGADIAFAQLLCLSYGSNLILGQLDSYDPTALIPASSWIMTTAAAHAVGPWRNAKEVFSFPSQEWLFRAWHGDRRRRQPRQHIVPTQHTSVIHIPSGRVKDSYIHDDPSDQARYTAHIMSGLPRALQVPTPPLPRLRRVLRLEVQRALAKVGLQPMAVDSALRYRGRRGREIDRLRRFRGLIRPES